MKRAFLFLALGILGLAAAVASSRAPQKAANASSASVEGSAPPRWTGTFPKPSDADLKKRLTPLQYEVTQHEATERAFANSYWNNKKPGIYVDIVSGEPLFSSLEMFDSGTGWPSFWQPLEPANVKQSSNLGGILGSYAEVRSAHAELASRTRLHRWAQADGAALLHELGGDVFHPGRGSREGRLRPVREAVRLAQ